jgi:hypothetical protein
MAIGAVQSGRGMIVRSQRFVRHPLYVRDQPQYDISLIESAFNIVFSATVQPVQLASSFVGGGVNAAVAGFGFWRTENPINSNILQFIRVTTLTNADCRNRLTSTDLTVFDHSICAFSRESEGICFRDAGGGLVSDAGVIGIAR